VDQWGDIVESLAGACADVTTVITGTSVDPHDYEPTTADIAKFTDAELVVVNGADYDPWALKAVATLPNKPPIVDAAEVVGVKDGANPHIWYGPDFVVEVAAAVNKELTQLLPKSATYLNDQDRKWQEEMKPYRDEIARIKAGATGRSYGATESVFDYMAEAVGLQNVTPQGYQNASAAESDPSPGDLNAFENALKEKKMDVLVYNTQTEGSIPEQINATAKSAGVPVVNVTESVPSQDASFEGWQVSQLRDLATALGL